MTNEVQRIRTRVARDYGQKAAQLQDGLSAESLGSGNYDEAEIAKVDDAFSFGCGNPVALAQVSEGQTVVDLGCGAGLDLVLAAERTGPTGRVIGVDMTAEMLERARHNIERSGHEHIELREGFIEELPVDDASVDWVLSNCVLNLSPDKPSTFAEIARVLRPGGQMLISDVVVERVPTWIRRLTKLVEPSVAGAIGEEDYVALLEQAGLRDISIKNRLVYDAAAIAGMIRDELESRGRLSRLLSRLLANRVARSVAGRVVSIKVAARRPGLET